MSRILFTIVAILSTFLPVLFALQNYFALPESNVRVALGLFLPIVLAIVFGWVYVITRLKFIEGQEGSILYRLKICMRSFVTVGIVWLFGAFIVHSFFLIGDELFSWSYYEGTQSLSEIAETQLWLRCVIASATVYLVVSFLFIQNRVRHASI